MAVVWEIAGMMLVVRGFVEVKTDKGLVVRFSAWVLVGVVFCLIVQARAHRTMWLREAREGVCPEFKINFVPGL